MKTLRSLFRFQWTGALLALGLACLLIIPAHAIDSGVDPEENSLVYNSTDGKLYGITAGGGLSTPNGTFFQWDPGNNLLTVKHAFAISGEGAVHFGLVKDANGKFYTCAVQGGANSLGCILKIDPASSYAVSIVYSITSGDGDEMRGPKSITLGRDGNLYISTLGTTDIAVGADGAIFKIAPDGTGKSILTTFSGTHNIQAWGGLVEDATTQGTFYGGTISNTSPRLDSGTLFSITSGGTYSLLHSFGGSDGKSPLGAPIVDGSIIYGTTAEGGSNGNGTLYKYDLSLSAFTNMYPLLSSTDGGSPKPLVWDSTNSLLYGYCMYGETYDAGTIFKYDPSGNTFTNLKTFTGTTGSVLGEQPVSPVLVGSTLYGVAFTGSSCDYGNIFKITVPGGASWTDLYDFFTPYTPTGLTATPGDAQIALNWTESLGTTYNIYRGTTPAGESGTPLASPPSTSTFTDTSLTNGTTYYYNITAVTTCNTSAASAEIYGTPFGTSTPGPSDLCARPGNAKVTLMWTAVANGNANIYRGISPGGPYRYIKQTTGGTSGTITTTDDTTALNGTTYYYVVAQSADTDPAITANTAKSNEASGTPSASSPTAPQTLVATPGTSSSVSVVLTWNSPSSNNATSYNVKRSTTNGSGYATLSSPSAPACPSSAIPSYTDSCVTNGVTYYYVVTAVNATGEGANSNQVSFSPAVPTAPSPSLSGGNAQLVLTWSSIAAATSYNIFRSITTGTEGSTPVLTNVTSPYTDTGLTNGTTYYYQITSVNCGGASAKSSEIFGTPFPASPAGPGGLCATSGSTTIAFTWPGISQKINLYRGASSGGPYQFINTQINATTGFTASCTDTPPGGGTYYYVLATSIDTYPSTVTANSAHSAEVAASLHSAAVPTAPQGLAGSPLNKSVALTWNAPSSDDTTSYHVKRSTTNGSGYATVNSPTTSCPTAAMSYTDTGLTNNTTYYYVVSAVDATGEGANSSQIAVTPTAPPAPTGLAVATGNAQLSLTWNTATGATSYNIYRGTTSGGESGTIYATSGTNSYTDASVTNGATYFYQVSGVNSSGVEGDKSTDDATTTTYNTPFSTTTSTAPAISGTTISTTEIDISWTISGSGSDNIYRAPASGGPYKYVGSQGGFNQSVTFFDIGLHTGTTYYYVSAKAGTTTPSSNEAHGTQISKTTN